MTDRPRIAVLGEALVDVVQPADGLSRAVPGGSGLNTCVALARLGAPVSFVGTLSSDRDGQDLAARLAREGVDLGGVLTSARPCPRVFATPGPDGSPLYDLRLAGSALDDAPVAWRAPAPLAHLHASSFATTTGPQGDASLAAMRAAREMASTSYDPNIRLAALPALPEVRALIAARIAAADIVKVSREDLAALDDGSGGLLQDWRALGPKLVVVTDGAAGARALFAGGEAQAPAPRVAVRDTIGAGDTFMAALLAQMFAEDALGRDAGGWSAAQVARWLAVASVAAALCCQRDGCDPPRRAELDAWLAGPNSVAPQT